MTDDMMNLNIMYLKCNACGKHLRIASHTGGPWTMDKTAEELNSFLSEHCSCQTESGEPCREAYSLETYSEEAILESLLNVAEALKNTLKSAAFSQLDHNAEWMTALKPNNDEGSLPAMKELDLMMKRRAGSRIGSVTYGSGSDDCYNPILLPKLTAADMMQDLGSGPAMEELDELRKGDEKAADIPDTKDGIAHDGSIARQVMTELDSFGMESARKMVELMLEKLDEDLVCRWLNKSDFRAALRAEVDAEHPGAEYGLHMAMCEGVLMRLLGRVAGDVLIDMAEDAVEKDKEE